MNVILSAALGALIGWALMRVVLLGLRALWSRWRDARVVQQVVPSGPFGVEPAPTANGYIVAYEGDGLDFIEHFGGVDWCYAPVPPKIHQCFPQTRGWMSGGPVKRCACGAINLCTPYEPPYWGERNTAGSHRPVAANS